MKREMKYSFWLLAAFLGMVVSSCKKNDIQKGEEVTVQNVSVSMKTTNGQVMVPEQDTGYTKTASGLSIPLEVSFSDAVPQRFNIGISANSDTVTKLIEAGKLDAVLLPDQYYSLPNQLDVLFGEDHADFNLQVDQTALEIYYGKILAIAVDLMNPTKGNALASGKKTAIVLINTTKVITTSEIHYVYFTASGKLLNIPEPSVRFYSQNTADLTVPVDLTLGADAGTSFYVKVSENQDTLQKLVSNHTLPSDVVLLKAGQDYQIPDSVVFQDFKNHAPLNIDFNVPTLQNNYTKKVALALTLSEPSSHLLDSSKRTLVLLLDPPKVLDTDITNAGSTFSVLYDNTHPDDQGENSPHLIDNNINTKFLIFDFKTPAWMQLQYPTPQYAGAYTMTSANDSPGRDPKNWELLGSNDGIHWTTLDVETNQLFPNRFQTYKYIFNNTVAYSYYRLNITANNGDGLYQQAEWRLLRRPQRN